MSEVEASNLWSNSFDRMKGPRIFVFVQGLADTLRL
jgi:hypothetical protein